VTPEQYVRDKAARSGSSFYYAFMFLPAPRRAAITAFYAFCREVDDVVDEHIDAGVAAAKLNWWRQEVARAFADGPTHPVMQALMPLTRAHGIEQAHLLAVIEGCQMDLEQTRYLDFATLRRYCHLVAGVVGEVAANIFGRSSERTLDYAHTLGLALQLTNIIRDVGDDARRGRIYLPVDELQRFGVKASEITGRRRHKSIALPRQVCMYLARRLTDYSLVEIGGQFGGRDHTTVIYANEKIAQALPTDRRLEEDLDTILRRIRSGE